MTSCVIFARGIELDKKRFRFSNKHCIYEIALQGISSISKTEYNFIEFFIS